MTVQEFQQIVPYSRITPQAINDIASDITGISYDLSKLRFVGFNWIQLSLSGLTLRNNEIGLILSSQAGQPQLQVDGSTITSVYPDMIFNKIFHATVGGVIGIQYALFTWD